MALLVFRGHAEGRWNRVAAAVWGDLPAFEDGAYVFAVFPIEILDVGQIGGGAFVECEQDAVYFAGLFPVAADCFVGDAFECCVSFGLGVFFFDFGCFFFFFAGVLWRVGNFQNFFSSPKKVVKGWYSRYVQDGVPDLILGESVLVDAECNRCEVFSVLPCQVAQIVNGAGAGFPEEVLKQWGEQFALV